jgi:arylsulfatase A-like enzyme
LLEFLNADNRYKGKVAAFGSWDAFDRILNEERSKFPVFSAFDPMGGTLPDITDQTINTLAQDSYKPFGTEECLDVFTATGAMHYLVKNVPRVLYISYGETDEWAHNGFYRDYLNSANMVDKWIKDIWTYVQENPLYRNKTALFITTDHGRGGMIKDEWTSHNNKIKDSHEIWFAVIGPGIKAKGEVKKPVQLYQKQFAQTMAALLGLRFTCEHEVAEKIELNRD